MTKIDNLYRSLSPLLCLSLMLGISPIVVKKHNSKVILYTNKYLYFIGATTIATFIAAILATFRAAGTASNVVSGTYYVGNKVGNYALAFVFLGGIVHVLTIFTCGLYRTQSIKSTLERIHKTDLLFHYIHQKINYKRIFVYQSVKQLSLFMFIAFAMQMHRTNSESEGFRKLSTMTWIIFAFPAVIINIYVNQFSGTVLLLWQRFKMINHQLIILNGEIVYEKTDINLISFQESNKMKNNNVATVVKKIRILRTIHHELCDVAKQVNINYTMQAMVNLFGQYGTMICAAFYMYWNYSIKPKSSISWVLWSTLKLFEIILITVACDITVTNAKQTGNNVHKLLIRNLDEEIKLELMEFSSQLMHRRLQFTLLGLLTLDTTLLFSVISSSATFMLIMLQFQKAAEPLTCTINV